MAQEHIFRKELVMNSSFLYLDGGCVRRYLTPGIVIRTVKDLWKRGTTVIALDGFIDVDPAFAEKADKWYVGNEKTDPRGDH